MLIYFLFQTRPFGVPSVRNDLPAAVPARRSMADPQNYGDDPSVKELVSPPGIFVLNAYGHIVNI